MWALRFVHSSRSGDGTAARILAFSIITHIIYTILFERRALLRDPYRSCPVHRAKTSGLRSLHCVSEKTSEALSCSDQFDRFSCFTHQFEGASRQSE
jgi:hypothetical protein